MLATIVPSLPPSVNGVGDYAYLLANGLRKNFGILSHFLVADISWEKMNAFGEFSTENCSRSTEQFARQLSKYQQVLLHFVNYAYQKRGCPLWLLNSLKLWKSRYPDYKLITIFHEVYAFGPPWTSSFWLSPVQRYIAQQLYDISDDITTSMNMYRDMLLNMSNMHKDIKVLPVFSNIGEPCSVKQVRNRSRRLIIFGGVPSRTKIYMDQKDSLFNVINKFDIKEVYDIGPPLPKNILRIKEFPIKYMGIIVDKKISEIMLDSFAGFIDYMPGCLAKSGIFAAYCAHGLVPICACYNPSEGDGIKMGRHYLSAIDLNEMFLNNTLNIDDIGLNALTWYKAHNINIHVQNLYNIYGWR